MTQSFKEIPQLLLPAADLHLTTENGTVLPAELTIKAKEVIHPKANRNSHSRIVQLLLPPVDSIEDQCNHISIHPNQIILFLLQKIMR